jgi:hypothetical protein
MVAVPFLMEGSDTVTAGLVEVEVVFEEVEELVAPVVDGVAEDVAVAVELEGVFEVEAGVVCSGGTKKIMKKAPTRNATMSNATKDEVLSPTVVRFLIKLVSKTNFLLLLCVLLKAVHEPSSCKGHVLRN